MSEQLNREQLRAAEFLDGVCLVVAVPGSGKTTVMTHRIGNLVKKHGIAPENILSLTFTRNAADAMREKLTPVLSELSHRVHMATIHSFCHMLLRREGRLFNVLSGKEQVAFIRDVLKRLKAKELSAGMVLREISLAKNNLVSLEEFRTLHEGDRTMQRVALAFEAYDREKARRMLLDFDDLLTETFRLLSENPEVRDKYAGTFRHLMVDEFQDVNPLQMGILTLLANGSPAGASFWACGDDWQSIYGFTGASVSTILRFGETFPDAHQMILNLNYRSTPEILAACQNLIRHNTRKIEKELKTENPGGEGVIVLESSSEESEAVSVVNEIRDLVERKACAFEDIACLYRCNFQSRLLEEAFLQHKIPYRIENGLCFYDRREVRILLDYLRLIVNPDSDEGDGALRAIINTPNRYLGRRFVSELEAFKAGDTLHLYAKLNLIPIELPYLRKNVRELLQLLGPMIEQAPVTPPTEAIKLLRVALDYDRFITEEDVPSPDDVKIENLNQLELAASRFASIQAFLDYTRGFQDEEASDSRTGVRLMTIHKAKGLEFPVVFVVGLVEGILPSKKGNLEEERRICFVACSRAMEQLYLSHSLTYLNQSAKRSIFVDEILGKINSPEPRT